MLKKSFFYYIYFFIKKNIYKAVILLYSIMSLINTLRENRILDPVPYFSHLYHYLNKNLDENETLRFYDSLVKHLTQDTTNCKNTEDELLYYFNIRNVLKYRQFIASKKKKLYKTFRNYPACLTNSDKYNLQETLVENSLITGIPAYIDGIFFTLDKNFVVSALIEYYSLINKAKTDLKKLDISYNFNLFLSKIGYLEGPSLDIDKKHTLQTRNHWNNYFNQDIAFIYYN